MWVQVQDRLPDRINFVSGNLVEDSTIRKLIVRTDKIRIGILSTGIVNPRGCCVWIVWIGQVRGTLREVARTLKIGRHSPFNIYRILLPGLFEIHEEECMVL